MIEPAVIDALVSSGCSPEQIAAVVKASMIAENTALEAKREKDRNRKRAARLAGKEAADGGSTVKCPALSDDVHGNPRTAKESTDITETVSLSPVPLLPPTPPNNPLTPNPIQKPNNTRGFRLPEDWTLTGPDLAFALSKGHGEPQIAEMFEKFTNYWWSAAGAKATKRDWHKAWKVWVLNTRPQSRAGPPTFAKPLTEHQRKQHETKEILDDLANFAAGRGGGSDQNPRLLRHNPGSGPESLRSGIGGDVDDLSPQRHRASG